MRVERQTGRCSKHFAALLGIYEASFPESERKAPALLEQMSQQPDYRFLLAFDGEAVVGFSISRFLNGTDAALLEYMAIAPQHRGRGLGQELFRRTTSFDSMAARHLLIEVDSEMSDAAPEADGARRKAFYRRLGCREFEGLAYRMPRVSAVDPPLMELLLFKDKLPLSLSTIQLREWLAACYTQVYGRASDDPAIDGMLTNLPSGVKLV